MTWNKISLIDFFLQNYQKEIILEEINSSFSIKGEIINIEELDLCINVLFQIQIFQKLIKKNIFLTLHDNFIGIDNESSQEKPENGNEEKRKRIIYKNLKIIPTKRF